MELRGPTHKRAGRPGPVSIHFKGLGKFEGCDPLTQCSTTIVTALPELSAGGMSNGRNDREVTRRVPKILH